MKAFDRKRTVITSVVMIQQAFSRVCPRTNNYFVALSCTNVSSFLQPGIGRFFVALAFIGFSVFFQDFFQPLVTT
jgi:hypothetical protein